MDPIDRAFGSLDPATAQWFRGRFGAPTVVQQQTWPRVAAGADVLATAPTGSGKTLAAFLVGLDRLLAGAWSAGTTRVLYVSPLKALASDIKRNLVGPLEGLEATWRELGREPPGLTVATRSGDTPVADRRRMVRSPPEILATTPESLALLLLSRTGLVMLEGVRLVILDEIHALVDNRRGLQLMLAVERLARHTGGLQRLALSATVTPLDAVARFVGGFERTTTGASSSYRARPVEVLDCRGPKRLEVEVTSCLAEVLEDEVDRPEKAPGIGPPSDDVYWENLRTDLRRRIAHNRASLVFANSRRMAEKLTRLLNRDELTEIAYSHHGSLAREVRQGVERRFAAGQLPAIVATSSLELGIDIGDLDEVLLVQTPPSVASTIQRVGRAGHSVAATSRGRLYPTHGLDLVLAAVVARAAVAQAVEPVRPMGPALDVLVQALLVECLEEPVELDELFARVRECAAYHELPRRHFDLVVELLAGRFAETRVRELAPRAILDEVAGTVVARRGIRRLLAQAGGTIPDRGFFKLRVAGTRALIGELDEEFVWERAVGDAFVLGAQSWRIMAITHDDVLVTPGRADAPLAPFWRGEERDRPTQLCEAVGDALEELEGLLAAHPEGRTPDPLAAKLQERFPLDATAARDLGAVLRRQRSQTGAPLPHRHHVLIEDVRDPTRPEVGRRLLVHTGWGGAVHRAWALALASAWLRRFGVPCAVLHDDDVVLVELPHDIETEDFFALVSPTNVDELVAQRLPRCGYFGARFREIAQVALVVPRGDARRRVPLWLARERAKKLLELVANVREFPLTLETWRTSFADGVDTATLAARLDEVFRGDIVVSRRTTAHPSPLATNIAWRQTNQRMYEDDTPDGAVAELGAELLADVMASGGPQIDAPTVAELEHKLARVEPGWAPAWGAELVAHIDERVALTTTELVVLTAAVRRDWGPPPPEHEEYLAARTQTLTPGTEVLVATRGWSRRLTKALAAADGAELAALLEAWLVTRGPIADADLVRVFGSAVALAEPSVLARGRVVKGRWGAASGEQWVDRNNLERLVRLARARRRPRLAARVLTDLPLFLAGWQGLTDPAAGDLEVVLARLRMLPLRAGLLEEEVLPARLPGYQSRALDRQLADGSWIALGAGKQQLAIVRADELDLHAPSGVEDHELVQRLRRGPARLGELALEFGGVAATSARLWRSFWAGAVACEDFDELRRAIANDFAPPTVEDEVRARRPGARAALASWRAAFAGGARWLALPVPDEGLDALDQLERDKARARIVLDRWGVVFRELLAREAPAMTWSRLFRALRLLELSGEVVSGVFFDGLGGAQFALPAAVARLARPLPNDAWWWCAATDPVAPTGLPGGLPGFTDLPRRVPNNRLVYRGSTVMAALSGQHLRVHPAPHSGELAMALTPILAPLARAVRPSPSLILATINGEAAAKSPYLPALGALAEISRSSQGVRLWRRWIAAT